MAEVRLYKSVWQGIKVILAGSFFVVPAIYFLNEEGTEKWIHWITIGIFSGCYLLGLYIIFDRRPHIIISEEGIYDRYYGRKIIPWSIIHGANLSEDGKICLFMEASYEPARGKIFMALNDFEKELGFQDLNLSNLWVRADKQKLLTLINTLRKANPKTRKDILERGMK